MKQDFDNTDIRKQLALDIAMHAPFDVPEGRAVFFSGGRNMRHALAFCKDHRDQGFSTLIETASYRDLMKLPLFGAGSPFTQEEAMDISALASIRFALAAKGNVTVFARKISDRSTFTTVELPALLAANENVPTINGADKMLWLSGIRPPVMPRTSLVAPSLLRIDTAQLFAANGQHLKGDPGSNPNEFPRDFPQTEINP